MKTKKLMQCVLLGSMLVITSSLFFSTKAHALRENGNTKLLVPCDVQIGETIIQIGNTCQNGGNGCTPNPCGE